MAIPEPSLRGAKRRGNLIKYPEIASLKLSISSRNDGSGIHTIPRINRQLYIITT
ncbi:hypothetical protein H6P87_00721 [Rickettsia tillamookensis]|uniref:Uncharacterized protein n=1 Tax=Rickettsia tillamookensis TaxID=2761623 RepID=A0A9E6SQM4_9RICK|nr:hypothetical protein H6P87_00721 [Rickettsia tillamookensis]